MQARGTFRGWPCFRHGVSPASSCLSVVNVFPIVASGAAGGPEPGECRDYLLNSNCEWFAFPSWVTSFWSEGSAARRKEFIVRTGWGVQPIRQAGSNAETKGHRGAPARWGPASRSPHPSPGPGPRSSAEGLDRRPLPRLQSECLPETEENKGNSPDWASTAPAREEAEITTRPGAARVPEP